MASLDPHPPPLRDRDLRDERISPRHRRGRLPEHDESASGAPELFYIAAGHAAFVIGGDEIDAPAGTCVWVSDPTARRSATAKADGTVVLAVGAAAPGQAYAPAGWDTQYLAGDK